MKILYLSHRIPYPPNKGDKIRSFNEIKHLSSTHAIDLACLTDDPADLKYDRDLKKFCKKICVVSLRPLNAKAKSFVSLASNRPLSVGYFYSQALQDNINSWLASNTYDAIICFSSPMAEYLFRAPALSSRLNSRDKGMRITSTQNPEPRTQNPVLIMDFCDVDSDKWRQYSLDSAFPLNLIYRIESSLLLRYEKKINQQFDHSVFISLKEAELFQSLYPEARNVTVILNGVDYDYFSPSIKFDAFEFRTQNSEPVLLFTGAMDYQANVDGVTWFCNEIFPMIKKEFPECQFFIVGSNPLPKVKELVNRDGVRVTGFVEDIRPFYQMADVCVISLRLARGVQNKVLEAMAMGKAVVTTTKSNEGIHAIPEQHLIVKNTPNGFADAVNRLLRGHAERDKIGAEAREFVIGKYDWSINMKKFDSIIRKS